MSIKRSHFYMAMFVFWAVIATLCKANSAAQWIFAAIAVFNCGRWAEITREN